MSGTQTAIKAEWPTIRINRAAMMEEITRGWWDRAKLASRLGNMADRQSVGCPNLSRQELFTVLPGFGARIAAAQTREACFNQFVEVMKMVASPEPGHEGAQLIIE